MVLNLDSIRAFVFDIDGVLTDGSLIPLSDGDLLRIVDAKDSFSIRFAGQQGYVTGIISGGDTPALRHRCRCMMVPEENICLGARGKLKIFNEFCMRNSIDPSEVAYFGDDISDIQVLKASGLGVAPADAVPEARAAADYVTAHPGGKGCAREVIEMVMRSQGKWVFDENSFGRIY